MEIIVNYVLQRVIFIIYFILFYIILPFVKINLLIMKGLVFQFTLNGRHSVLCPFFQCSRWQSRLQ